MKKLLFFFSLVVLPLFAQDSPDVSDVIVSFRPPKYANAILKQGSTEKKGRAEGTWTTEQIQLQGKKWVMTGQDKQNVTVPFEFKEKAFSVSFWFQPSALAEGSLFFTTTRHPYIGVKMVPNKGKESFALHCLMGLTPKATLARSASDFEINKPYFLTLSLNEKGYYLLGINGEIELETTIAGRENPLNAFITFGGPNVWSFPGEIWNVQLHSKALTEEEIGKFYQLVSQQK